MPEYIVLSSDQDEEGSNQDSSDQDISEQVVQVPPPRWAAPFSIGPKNPGAQYVPPPPVEPPPVEPLPTEPLPAEPLPAEPLPAEPLPAEPPPLEPLPAPGEAAATHQNMVFEHPDICRMIGGAGAYHSMLKTVAPTPACMIDAGEELLTWYGQAFNLAGAVASAPPPDPVLSALSANPDFRSGGVMGLINEADREMSGPLPPGIAYDRNTTSTFLEALEEWAGVAPVRPKLLALGGSSRVERRVRNLNRCGADFSGRPFGAAVEQLVDTAAETAARLVRNLDQLVEGLATTHESIAYYAPMQVVPAALDPVTRRSFERARRQIHLVWEPNVAEQMVVPGAADRFHDTCVHNVAVLWILQSRHNPVYLVAVCNALQNMGCEALNSWYGPLRGHGVAIADYGPPKGFGLQATDVIEPVSGDADWKRAAIKAADQHSKQASMVEGEMLARPRDELAQLAPRLAATTGGSISRELLSLGAGSKRRRHDPGEMARVLQADDAPLDPGLRDAVVERLRFVARVERAAAAEEERCRFQSALCRAFAHVSLGQRLATGVMRGVVERVGSGVLDRLGPTTEALDQHMMYAFPVSPLDSAGEKTHAPTDYHLLCTFCYTGPISPQSSVLLMRRRWLVEAVTGEYGRDELGASEQIPDDACQAIWAFERGDVV